MHLPLPLLILSLLALILSTMAQPFPRHKALHALHHRHHHAHPPTELHLPSAEARQPELDAQQRSTNSDPLNSVLLSEELRER